MALGRAAAVLRQQTARSARAILRVRPTMSVGLEMRTAAARPEPLPPLPPLRPPPSSCQLSASPRYLVSSSEPMENPTASSGAPGKRARADATAATTSAVSIGE